MHKHLKQAPYSWNWEMHALQVQDPNIKQPTTNAFTYNYSYSISELIMCW